MQIDEVMEIGSRKRAGGTRRKCEYGRDTNLTVHVAGRGFLRIEGAAGKLAGISVSPASLRHTVGKSKKFLNSTQAHWLTLFTIANWKCGGLMDGLLTMLILLDIVGYSLGLLNWLLRINVALIRQRQQ